MIDIKFRDCCHNCREVEIDYDYIERAGGKHVVVFCQHMGVCYKYKESKRERDIAELNDYESPMPNLGFGNKTTGSKPE